MDKLCGIESSEKKEPVKASSLGDVARSVIGMCKIAGVELQNVSYEKTYRYINRSTGYPDERTHTYYAVAVVFSEGELEKFVTEWVKVKAVCDGIEMGDTLYSSWTDKRLSQLDKLPVEANIPCVELEGDGELPF